jgi:hypothetical protein
MNAWLKSLLLLQFAFLSSETCHAQIRPLVIDPRKESTLINEPATDPENITKLQASLDSVLDWSNPLALTQAKLDAALPKENFQTSPFYAIAKDGKSMRMGRRPYSNVEVNLTIFGGQAVVESMEVNLNEGRAEKIEIEFAPPTSDAVLEAALGEKWKSAPVNRPFGQQGGVFQTWSQPGATAILVKNGTNPTLLKIVPPERAAMQYVVSSGSGSGSQVSMLCDLDFLFDLPATWALTAESMDARFDMRDSGFEKPACFEWLSSAKDRLRFTRKPFSNVSVDLRLFGGQMKVEDATLDFKNGRLSLATLSLYNRGDSGSIKEADFDRLYKLCGQQVGQALKTSPRQQPPAPGKAIKTTSWLWASQTANALMEYSDFGIKGREIIAPEFLRLKLGAPGPMDWNFNQAPSGLLTKRIMKADLVKNVTKGADGDIYIKGVPMVDQGDKGYCVAASCQRLFEYYQLPADQHEFAKLFGTTAAEGTSAREMEEALDKVDNRFKTRFKPLYNLEMKRSRDRRAEMDAKKLLSFVKDHADKGVPLLWTLVVGVVPEDPPLSTPAATLGPGGFGRMQATGGHMRMIIGYNEQRNQVIFTDSWGEGHEIKRMAISDAASVTDGVYLLEPRW